MSSRGRVNYRSSGRPKSTDKSFACYICKRYGKTEYHNFKECTYLGKLDVLLDDEKKRVKDEENVLIAKVISEQVKDTLQGPIREIKDDLKVNMSKLKEIHDLLKRKNNDSSDDVEIIKESLPPTVDQWCRDLLTEVNKLSKKSKKKVRKAIWDDKVANESDRWETVFHLLKMLQDDKVGGLEDFNVTFDTKIDDVLDAICGALV